MDARVLTLPDDITAGQALARLRRSSRHAHHYLYVVDREERLVGVLNLRELMVTPPRQSLAGLMSRQVAQLPASADRAAILAHPGWREVHALPVVDGAGRFLGVVRHETVRLLEQESVSPRGSRQVGTVGLALADLCWVGMAKILVGLATATFHGPATHRSAGGGNHGTQL